MNAIEETVTDVVIVGARCAGAATAALLARQQINVVVVDRAEQLGDTLSTHSISRGGVVQLTRWGLIDAVLASGAPAITKVTFHVDGISNARKIEPVAGADFLLAPRRRALDSVILGAAVKDGADVRLGVSVNDVIRDSNGRVVGVTGRTSDGHAVRIRARLVIGADGVRSRIARAVGAAIGGEAVTDTGGYFTYFDGIPWDGFEFYVGDHNFAGMFPTNDRSACVWVMADSATIEAVRAEHGASETGFLHLASQVQPALIDRLGDARRTDRVRVALRYPSFVRHPAGDGWALVGDAGYHRDAITGHGITDAFRDAELVATAVSEWLQGARAEAEAMHRYAVKREAGLRPIFEVTNALASWPEPGQFLGLQNHLNRLLDIEAKQLASGPPPPMSTAAAA